MRMKRRERTIHMAAALLGAVIIASGCSSSEAKQAAASQEQEQSPYETLELRYQGALNGVTFPELAEEMGYLAPIKLKWIGNTISGPQDIQTAATGQSDFGGAFNGAIVKLIAAKAPIKAVIGYYGVDEKTYSGFYVLDGSPIESARDLIGKKVGMNTLGAHHEFVLTEYLRRNGLTEEEIKQVTLVVVPPVNTEQTLRQGQIDVAVLGGILRDKALERGGIHSLFSDYELFGTFTAGSYVFTEKFIAEHPNTVQKFVEATSQAIRWAQTTPREEVIAKYEEIITKRGRNESTDTIQYWQSTGVAGKGGLIREEEFKVWVDWLEKSEELEEGTLALEDLYTNQYNLYQDEQKASK